ncbi:MAG: hypothetical protein PHI16_06595, partial [Methanocellales archaeon]|nr:hypothetical protein [Methanocellales archaeon]
MSNEVQKYQGGQVAEYSAADVIKQVTKIQEIMRTVMKKDEHYGIIPGCGDKPTLLKSGAEKLAFTFRLAPDFQIDSIDMQGGHREYKVVTRITNSVTGDFLGSGVGAATTMETKWRYRTEICGDVPQEYWESRNSALLGGTDYSPKKINDKKTGKSKWVIVHKVEHDNPADYYNTCLKMAKKRSLVDGILTCTAASDLFSQDLEELKENGVIADVEAGEEKESMKKPQAKPAQKMNSNQEAEPEQSDTQNKASGRPISEKQSKLIYAKCKGKGMSNEQMKAVIFGVTGKQH